jgi:hypothetical protein
VRWLTTAAMLFDWVYKNGDNSKPTKIEVKADSAK